MIDVELWMNAVTKPKEVFTKEKKNASLREGVKQYAIAGVLAGIILGIIAAFLSALFPLQATMYKGYGIAAVVVVPIITAVVYVIGSLIGAGILYVIAKLLGGKGTYTQQYYLSALFAVPMMVLSTLVGLIPVVGAIIGFLVGLYTLYLLVLALKEAHQYSTARAAATILIIIAIAMVVAMLIAAWFTIALGGMMGGLPAAA